MLLLHGSKLSIFNRKPVDCVVFIYTYRMLGAFNFLFGEI